MAEWEATPCDGMISRTSLVCRGFRHRLLRYHSVSSRRSGPRRCSKRMHAKGWLDVTMSPSIRLEQLAGTRRVADRAPTAHGRCDDLAARRRRRSVLVRSALVSEPARTEASPPPKALALGGLAARVCTHDGLDRRVGSSSDSATSSSADRPTARGAAQPFGTATAERPGEAILQGLSDRLGWEAVVAWQAGAALSNLECANVGTAQVLDGRLGHEVPTVVVVGAHTVRWGAGSTWQRAIDRAVESTPTPSAERERSELSDVTAALAEGGFGLGVVDVTSTALHAAGLFRCCVELLVGDVGPPPTPAQAAPPWRLAP